jgi:hypothetical protein
MNTSSGFNVTVDDDDDDDDEFIVSYVALEWMG